jgi:hypothetical protein
MQKLERLLSDFSSGSTVVELESQVLSDFKMQLIFAVLELLSQSVTYLLHSEVESKKQATEIEALSAKVG